MNTTFAAASEFLASLDEHWAQLVEQVGPCTHEPKPARKPRSKAQGTATS